MEKVIRRMLRDIQVELDDEFDRNFERQGFFNEKWQRSRRAKMTGGATLIDTGELRRSVRSRMEGSGVTWESTLPYAAIHNEGGEIRVTARMKRYFWARYYAARGKFTYKRDGGQRNDKRNRGLTAEADFWQAMALKKVGSVVKIPKRQYMGWSPEVEKVVREVIEEGLEEFAIDDL